MAPNPHGNGTSRLPGGSRRRQWLRRRRHDLQWTYEAIAFAYDRFHIARIVGIILQSLSQFADDAGDVAIGIDEYAFAPQPGGNLVAGYELSPAFHEKDEQLHALPLEMHRAFAVEQLITLAVQPELACEVCSG